MTTYTPKQLQDILSKHNKWLSGEKGRECADLRGANLRGADLSGADLSDAKLSDAKLSYANLSCANLRDANLRCADLSGADLRGANLRGADLSGADLRGANMSYANLSCANLSYANLSDANLSGADLSDANLSDAKLSYANLSGVKGLLNPIEWMTSNFKTDRKGYIVYKAFGKTTYTASESWKIEAGNFIEEVVNQLPTLDCACGVNFATLKWIKQFYADEIFANKITIWKCRINWKDACSIVVPYNTDGKARCGRLELLEEVAS